MLLFIGKAKLCPLIQRRSPTSVLKTQMEKCDISSESALFVQGRENDMITCDSTMQNFNDHSTWRNWRKSMLVERCCSFLLQYYYEYIYNVLDSSNSKWSWITPLMYLMFKHNEISNLSSLRFWSGIYYFLCSERHLYQNCSHLTKLDLKGKVREEKNMRDWSLLYIPCFQINVWNWPNCNWYHETV